MTSMTKTIVSLVVVGLVALVASPASAAVIFSDNFDDSIDGALEGNIADTGQTWGGAVFELVGTHDTLDVGTAYGGGGTKGAGSTLNLRSNGVSLLGGEALPSGAYRLEADVQNGGGVVRLNLVESGLNNLVAALKWRYNGGTTPDQVWFEGLDLSEGSEPAISFVSSGMHIALDVDLTLKTVKYSYYDLADPTKNGSKNLGTYTTVWAPWQVALNFGGGDGTRGFDNVVLQTIEAGIPGDVNFDGVVNIFDINLVSANWGDPGGAPIGDANNDGVVNIFDINLISSNWTPSGGAAVPEPSCLALAALALTGFVCMLRRPGQRARRS